MTLVTDFGYFNVIIFTFALSVSLLISKIIVILAKFNAVKHEEGVDKCMSYLSGYSESDIKKIQNSNEFAGKSLLCGFKEALKFYYPSLKREHGNLFDYNIWLMIILSIILLIIVLVGVVFR